jgi:ATP-binding cassette, subfamily B, bacterial
VNLLRVFRFLLFLGTRADRARLARAVTLMLAGYLAAPLASWTLAVFTDDVLAHRSAAALTISFLIALLLVAQTMLSHFAHLDYFELAESQESRLRTELIELVNRPMTVGHLDDPGFADSLALVREALFDNTRALEAVLQLSGLLLQTAVTVAILAGLNPLLILLPLAAVPPVLVASRAQAMIERARERSAEQARMHRHLLGLATAADSVKELRIFGAGPEILRRHDAAWHQVTGTVCRGQAAAAALRCLGQLLFAAGYGGAILLVVRQAVAGRATVGDIVMVITLAAQVSAQISGAFQLTSYLQSAGTMIDRIASMRRSAAAESRDVPRTSPPGVLRQGISLERLSFSYAGSAEPVLQDIQLHIPPGHVLAIVGENGAGKSTLVKLLCGLYAPTYGCVHIDGTDLADIDPLRWRAGVAALFQDFYRLELTARESIGLGELSLLDDTSAVTRAIAEARADRVLDAIPGRLDGLLGHGYGDGAGLSGGQWQTIALARCFMRSRPLLLILDEPAAALDAAAEHALFERYASSASAAARETGCITILVSHRFSTVRMADSIAVLDGGRLAEHGTHAELMTRNGLYAELFRLQARVYQ